ncbi:hypothetical protein [Sutcliffiella sp. FSL R7-0096]|uniref:hypothetical protein n=1 Tax=Sutcliffiella sp. FSL R7-0096 TaxID=2921670 RepID=UPI00315A8106
MSKFYFEFIEHDYYGLVTVSVDKYDLNVNPYKKASKIYFENVGGESLEQVLEEAQPILVTKELAFMKFMKAPNTLDNKVSELIAEFENSEDVCLLVDGSLI